jgi:hypothetical protein
MPGGAELSDPVAYSGPWGVVAVVLPLLVVAWYAAATWWTRDRTGSRRPPWWRVRRARRAHLRELDRIEAAVAAGAVSPRQAHQAVSATVRSFAAAVGPVDARPLNLEQLREAAPRLVGVVESAYPSAFQPGPERAEEQLGTVLEQARATLDELGR